MFDDLTGAMERMIFATRHRSRAWGEKATIRLMVFDSLIPTSLC